MIGDYTNQDVWHKPRSGMDGYGQPTFAAAVKWSGRWIEKRRLVRDQKGEQVLSEVSVTLGPDTTVAAGDQVSADNAIWLTIITVAASRDLGGDAVLKRAFC